MRPIVTLPVIIFQIGMTFCILFGVFMIFAFADTDEFDLVNNIALLTIKPFIGAIISLVTILFSLLLGLPLRMSAYLNNWIKAKKVLVLIAIGAGFFILLLSVLPPFQETVRTTINGGETNKQIPNT